MIVADGQRHQLLKLDLFLAVSLDQLGADVGQLEPLPDDGGAASEAGGLDFKEGFQQLMMLKSR